MNKMAQFSFVLGILFLGGFLQTWFSLPIPSTILGMIILFFLLLLKIVKLKWVEDIGNILLDNLSILFVPAGVGIMRKLHMFEGKIISLSFIILVSTIIVLVVTAYTTQALEKNKRGSNR